MDAYNVSVQFQKPNGQPCWLTCVYEPRSNDEKILFLQELRQIRSACHDPWVVVGDEWSCGFPVGTCKRNPTSTRSCSRYVNHVPIGGMAYEGS